MGRWKDFLPSTPCNGCEDLINLDCFPLWTEECVTQRSKGIPFKMKQKKEFTFFMLSCKKTILDLGWRHLECKRSISGSSSKLTQLQWDESGKLSSVFNVHPPFLTISQDRDVSHKDPILVDDVGALKDFVKLVLRSALWQMQHRQPSSRSAWYSFPEMTGSKNDSDSEREIP